MKTPRTHRSHAAGFPQLTTLYTCLAVCAVALLYAGIALAQPPFTTQDDVLVNEAGMTVYTFDKDTANSGQSACVDTCAQNWPPAEAAADATAEGDYTIIKRADGTQQWAYQGQPLYTFAKDTNAGDRTGDDVGGVWHVVKP